MKQKSCKYTSIGGSALIEGVMMRGNNKMAIAVRKGNGDIILKVENTKPANKIISKIPIVRGVFGFITSMMTSYKSLMYSADVAMEDAMEEEPQSKFEAWLTKALGKGLMTVLSAIAVVLGVVISIGAFIYLPSLLVDLLSRWVPVFDNYILKRVTAGVMKMVIFLVYMLLATRMQEMKTLFKYHGAEHKTIFCYEAGKELTPENSKTFKRFHPRCGTSFIIIVLLVSICVSMVIPWDKGVLLHSLIKLLLLPCVMGLAYEFIKLAGKYDNIFTRIISAPGLWFQRITTREPDEKQLEIAMWAMKGVLEDCPMDTRLRVTEDGTLEEDKKDENDGK